MIEKPKVDDKTLKLVDLGPKETVTFEVLGTRTDTDKKNQGRMIIQASVNVPPISQYLDSNGNFTTTTYITGKRIVQNTDENPDILGEIHFTSSQAGFITCRGSNPQERALAIHLRLCSWNKSGIGKSYHVAPIGNQYKFKELDKAKSASEKRAELDKILDAQLAVKDWSLTELVEYARGQGINHNLTQDELRMQFNEIAKSNPEKILHLDDDYHAKIKGELTEAVDFGLIVFDQSRGWTWAGNGNIITRLVPGVEKYKLLTDYIISGHQGESFLNSIRGSIETEQDMSIED